MKGARSHRPQSSDPPDDWVDGSWTVDCICGVTFDDGEEMVKCDECGVWVHTRCSRYVKGEETFSCDKCKNNRNNQQNNSAENEIAQVLIELPTKTITMDNFNMHHNNNNTSLAARSRRPFKLWADIPMEERVHVQGIPGGDSSIFGSNLSSIFNPQLWKCTGYVPKRFNFQYREFPCWDENDGSLDNDNGAGVLFSFSKERTVLASPVAALVDTRSGVERKGGFKEMGKFGSDGNRVHNGVKKERSLLRPVVVNSGKRKKDEFGASNSKDRSGKKRVRSSEKEVDLKRRSLHSSKTAFTPTSDAKQLEFYEDRGPKVFKGDSRSMKNKNLKDMVVHEHISNDCFAVETIMEEPSNNLTTTEDSSEALYPDATRHSFSAGDVLPAEKAGHKAPTLVEMSSKTDDAVTSVLKHNSVGNASIKEKAGDSLPIDNSDDTSVLRSTVSPHVEVPCGSATKVNDNQMPLDLDRNLHPSSAKCKVKVKREDDGDDSRKLSNLHSSPINDLKHNEKPSGEVSDIVKMNDAVVNGLPSPENKVGTVDRLAELDDHTNKPDELSGDVCHGKQELEGSEGSMETKKGFSEIKDGSDSVKDSSKSEKVVCSNKILECTGKSSPPSSTLNSKSLANDIKSEDSETPYSFTKHVMAADSNIHIKNESCLSDALMDGIPRKSIRDRPKSSPNPNSKGLHSSRSMPHSILKQVNSDAKDSFHSSSSKASLPHHTASISGSSETNTSLHQQKALQVSNKVSSSVPQRVEKSNQTNVHPTSKLNQNHVPSVNPSPTSNSSMLSDEELALLLHQELNSSPRVPRVPRARQAGSLPQLNSSSATSMLMKRTSSVGGKDHSSVFRRKYKDASRDGHCSSRELEEEAKGIEKEKVSTSSDQRKQDMACVEDASVKEEGHASLTAVNSVINNVSSATSAIANSSPPSPPEDQNLSSIRSSPRNISDDDTSSAGRPIHRTLPGLINDIMSKGRRMTYEELCNAVLPHWHNLRKHNGERYAYSSHSQAVLDCLRNRHEWARLVDRGPKTNTNRKRRKVDTEESDDNEYGKGRTVKEVEGGKNFELQKEEFPKGKRKARKRRRLALQGRAIKDVRKRHKTDSLTDDDVGPFSNSSDESMSSEDEIQVGRIGPAGSTSDEADSA